MEILKTPKVTATQTDKGVLVVSEKGSTKGKSTIVGFAQYKAALERLMLRWLRDSK